MSEERCKAEIGMQGTRYLIKPCPEPAVPGEDYCPLHLILVRRLEDRHRRMFNLEEVEDDAEEKKEKLGEA